MENPYKILAVILTGMMGLGVVWLIIRMVLTEVSLWRGRRAIKELRRRREAEESDDIWQRLRMG